jgi:site-specific DNA-methyltransferase (adenine-specific)
MDVLELTAQVVGAGRTTIARARQYLEAIEKYPELREVESPLAVIKEFQRREELKRRKEEVKRIEEAEPVDLSNLILGDCVEKVELIPDNSIDAIITDPPYGVTEIGVQGRWRTRKLRGEEWSYQYQTSEEIFQILDRFFERVKPKQKEDAHIYIFTNWLSWCRLAEVVAKHFTVKNCLIYYYGPSLGNYTTNYANSYGMILFAGHKKERGLNNIGVPNCFIAKRPRTTTYHPAEKSLEVLEWLIGNSTVEGETVLDPFCGSGSTLVAAEKMGRRWYGIEIDPKWYEVAKMRILELRKERQTNG